MDSTTSFLDLPASLQLQIVKLTSWQDQRRLRLVCKLSLALVNHLAAPLDLNPLGNHLLIEELKSCPFPLLKTIEFKFLTAPLQIVSSTRLKMPKALHIELGKSISTENLLKLIRYYIKWCKTLELRQTDIPFLRNIALFGPSQTCLTNIKKLQLSFYVSMRIEDRDPEMYFRRLKSLGQFLLWCSIPSLQELDMFFSNDMINDEFDKNIQIFLIKHGPRLKYLRLHMSSSFWQAFIKCCQFMTKVEKFDLESDGLEPIGYDEILKGFNYFTQLNFLKMDCTTEFSMKLSALLLRNNKKFIQTLDLSHYLKSLCWFYKIDSFTNLSHLHLKVSCKEDSKIFTTFENFKLDSLSKLTILIRHEQVDLLGDDFDWREPFINWLLLFSPNLHGLNLKYYDSKFQIRISDMEVLIHDLTSLKIISFHTLYHDFVSFDLKDWLNRNPNIHLKRNEYWYDCIIEVKRPYMTSEGEK